jgi:hypothetical protein
MKGTSKKEDQVVWRPPATPEEERSVWLRVTSPDEAEVAARGRARLRTGILLGATLGLAYGLVSQFINPIMLPGIPLYSPPAGALGNAILSALMGGMLGALTCYPASAARGIFYGAIVALIGIFAYMLIRLGVLGFGGALISSTLLSLPLAWLTVPLLGAIRWASERQVDAARNHEPALRRVAVPLALILAMAVAGAFELHSPEARGNLRSAHELLQQGLSAPSAAASPAPVRDALQILPPGSRQSYTLEWTQYDLDRFHELRPPSSFDEHAAVIARFAGDYYVVCLYPTPTQEPNCAGYDELPGKAPQRRDD